MRTLLRSEVLYVSRSSSRLLNPPFKSEGRSKWVQLPVALFCEDNENWLVVFADQIASAGFFANSSDGLQMRASEMSSVLRMRTKHNSQLRSIIELLAVSDVESCTEDSKPVRRITGSHSDEVYFVDLQYNYAISNEKPKKMRLRLASQTQSVASDWLQAIKSVIKCKDSPTSNEQNTSLHNDAYACFQPIVFLVKLTGVPETCPEKLGLIVSTSYKLRLDFEALTLLSVADSHMLTRWPYLHIRRFGLPTDSDKQLLWFEAGNQCETGEGAIRFHATDALHIHRLLLEQNERIKKVLLTDTCPKSSAQEEPPGSVQSDERYRDSHDYDLPFRVVPNTHCTRPKFPLGKSLTVDEKSVARSNEKLDIAGKGKGGLVSYPSLPLITKNSRSATAFPPPPVPSRAKATAIPSSANEADAESESESVA